MRFTRCARPTARGVSTYTILGFIGYLAATVLAAGLGAAWDLSLAERLIGCVAPPAAFVLAVALTAAIAGREKIVFYEISCAAIGAVAVLAAIAGGHYARLVDLATLGIGMFLVFGRVGCLFVACCHGTPGRGITYGPPHVAVGFWSRWIGRPLWPVQLVEAFASAALVILGLAWSVTPGTAAIIFVTGYAVLRFPLELLRGDAARPYVLGVSEAQWFAIATLGACALWRPSVPTLAPLAVMLVAAWILVAGRHRRALSLPAHLRELDRLMATAREGMTGETSLGVAVSRHALGDGRIDWVLSSRHPAWSVVVARRIAKLLWPSFELVEGRSPGVVHVIEPAARG